MIWFYSFLTLFLCYFYFLHRIGKEKFRSKKKSSERCCLAFLNIEINDRNQISTVEHKSLQSFNKHHPQLWQKSFILKLNEWKNVRGNQSEQLSFRTLTLTTSIHCNVVSIFLFEYLCLWARICAASTEFPSLARGIES